MTARFWIGILRSGSLLFGVGILVSTGCSQGSAPADLASTDADRWIRFLSTGDPPHRIEAVTGLGRLRKPEYVEYILKAAVTDRQIPVRVAAIEALGQPGFLNDNAVRSVVLLLGAAEMDVRMAACRAIGEIKPPDAAEALMRSLHDREASVRLTAAESLGKLGPSVIPLFKSIFDTGSPDQKTMIASIAGKKKDPLYADLMVSGLKDDDDGVRRTCAEALGLLGATTAIPSLVSLANEPLSSARLDEFKQMIHQRPSESDYSVMIRLLDEDCIRRRTRPDPNRYTWLRNGMHTNIYRRALDIRQRDAANLVRSSAVQAIINIAPAGVDDVLVAFLANADEDMGNLASQTLRQRGDSARPILLRTAQDPKRPSLARCRAADTLAPSLAVVEVNQTDKLRLLLSDKSDGEVGVEETKPKVPATVELPPDIRQLFVGLLADPDLQLRATVAVHLGRAGTIEAIEPLLEVFRKADPAEMDRVAIALASFKDDRIAPALIPALDDARYASCVPAIVATLGAVGDKRASPSLLSIVGTHSNLNIRLAAIDALRTINDPSTVKPMLEWIASVLPEFREVHDTPTSSWQSDRARFDAYSARFQRAEDLMLRAVAYLGSTRSAEAADLLLSLVEYTKGSRETVAMSAMRALGDLKDARAVKPISESIVKHGAYSTRYFVNSLSKAGIDAIVAIRDPGGIEVLKGFAADWQNPKDPFTGKYAIEAMGRMKHPDAVAVLIRYLTDPDVDPAMQDACVGPALAAAGVVAKEPLLKLLKESPKPKERARTDPGMYAAQILAVMDKPEVNIIPDLARILAAKPPSHIVQRVTESLAQTHHEAAVLALAETLKTGDIPARQLAALALGKARLRSVTPYLHAALNDTDAKVVECAATSLLEAILEKPDVNAIPDIVRILAAKPPSLIVMRVVDALGQIRQDAALQALADIFKTADVPTRELAANAMGRSRMSGAIPHLHDAMRDTDSKVREAAANALLDVLLEKPDASIVPELAAVIATKPPPAIAQRVTEALGQMHQEVAVQALANILKTADAPTRELAAVALGKVKLRSAIPHLKAAQQDADAKVRASAAGSLVEYGVGSMSMKKE
jgi:HEAT repeat protein